MDGFPRIHVLEKLHRGEFFGIAAERNDNRGNKTALILVYDLAADDPCEHFGWIEGFRNRPGPASGSAIATTQPFSDLKCIRGAASGFLGEQFLAPELNHALIDDLDWNAASPSYVLFRLPLVSWKHLVGQNSAPNLVALVVGPGLGNVRGLFRL